MKHHALLVIDVQTALVESHPYNEKIFLSNIKQLIQLCRNSNIPVIYIQHDGGTGDELGHGTEGWTIFKDIAPLETDTVLEKKFNSAFRRTRLKEILNEINAENIIICGMQSEHCIDASCKVAFEYGYHITIVKDTTSTFDNGSAAGQELAQFYENRIWNNRYADVITMEQLITELWIL